jgi:hypothetical protein
LKELHDRGFVSRARVLVKDSQGGAPQYVYTLTRAGFEAAKRAEPQPAIFPPDRKFKELEGDGDNMGHDHAVVHWLLMIESLLGPDVVRDTAASPPPPRQSQSETTQRSSTPTCLTRTEPYGTRPAFSREQSNAPLCCSLY